MEYKNIPESFDSFGLEKAKYKRVKTIYGYVNDNLEYFAELSDEYLEIMARFYILDCSKNIEQELGIEKFIYNLAETEYLRQIAISCAISYIKLHKQSKILNQSIKDVDKTENEVREISEILVDNPKEYWDMIENDIEEEIYVLKEDSYDEEEKLDYDNEEEPYDNEEKLNLDNEEESYENKGYILEGNDFLINSENMKKIAKRVTELDDGRFSLHTDFSINSLDNIGEYLSDAGKQYYLIKEKNEIIMITAAYYGEVIIENTKGAVTWINYEDLETKGLVNKPDYFNDFALIDNNDNSIIYPIYRVSAIYDGIGGSKHLATVATMDCDKYKSLVEDKTTNTKKTNINNDNFNNQEEIIFNDNDKDSIRKQLRAGYCRVIGYEPSVSNENEVICDNIGNLATLILNPSSFILEFINGDRATENPITYEKAVKGPGGERLIPEIVEREGDSFLYFSFYKNGHLNEIMFDGYNDKNKERLDYVNNNFGSKKCFVATVVYNSEVCYELNVLRAWRDDYLKNHILGRTFIKLYYKYGESLANFISPYDKIKKFTKKVLDKIIIRLETKDLINNRFRR